MEDNLNYVEKYLWMNITGFLTEGLFAERSKQFRIFEKNYDMVALVRNENLAEDPGVMISKWSGCYDQEYHTEVSIECVPQ